MENNNTNNERVQAQRLAYANHNERKRASKDERAAAMLEYTTRVLANKRDDGRNGKVFEVDVRWNLNENTTVLKVQRPGLADIVKKLNGKRVNIEAKTGGGNICQLPETTEINRETVLSACKFDLIIYSVDADYSNARVMTAEQFIDMLTSYNPKKPNTFFKRESGKGRNRTNIKINNPTYDSRYEYLINHDYGVDYETFSELVK